jgi:hypothetical protein
MGELRMNCQTAWRDILVSPVYWLQSLAVEDTDSITPVRPAYLIFGNEYGAAITSLLSLAHARVGSRRRH